MNLTTQLHWSAWLGLASALRVSGSLAALRACLVAFYADRILLPRLMLLRRIRTIRLPISRRRQMPVTHVEPRRRVPIRVHHRRLVSYLASAQTLSLIQVCIVAASILLRRSSARLHSIPEPTSCARE